MRREKVFSKGGTYGVVLHQNLCMHQEASEVGRRLFQQHLQRQKTTPKKMGVLDLACGGEPVTIAQIMADHPDIHFDYVGVDINPDQVAVCRQFKFPKNVVSKKVIKGNAWSLLDVPLKGLFDLVFLCMTTHHAIPEEIFYALQKIHPLLKSGGLILNHDLFRPERFAYLRRPSSDPKQTEESLELIPKKWLPAIPNIIPTIAKKGSDWRKEHFFPRHREILKEMAGLSEKEIKDSIAHMTLRDYPVSLEEMQKLLELTGFTDITLQRYQETKHPIQEFFGMIAAHRPVKQSKKGQEIPKVKFNYLK